MHLKSTFPTLLAIALVAVTPTFAAEKKAPAPTAAEAALIAKARETYPLKKCIVSDEDLGSMGEATPFVYHQAGKPDRVVFFCCDGCIDDFKADPAKYLKKLDDAAAAAKSGKSAPAAKETGAKKKHDH